MMNKKQAEHMGKLYREFSRQKYTKYKHQYPKMRESEIVSKIIHDWDAMDIQAKNKLQQLYQNNKFLIKQDHEEYESCKKSADNAKIAKTQQLKPDQKTASKSTPLKEESHQNEHMGSVAKFEPSQINSHVDSSVVPTPKSETKKISKLGRRDYLSFFKLYYSAFRREHPNWNQKQVSSTIALLWKKRKQQNKAKMPKKKLPRKIIIPDAEEFEWISAYDQMEDATQIDQAAMDEPLFEAQDRWVSSGWEDVPEKFSLECYQPIEFYEQTNDLSNRSMIVLDL